MPQAAERGQENIFDILCLQRTAKRIAVELRVVTRTRHRADVGKAGDAIDVQQRDEFFYGQGRMPDRENSPFGPARLLRRRMFAHHVDRRNSSTVTPNELEITIERSGLSVLDERGVVYPLRNAWQPSTDVDVNHMVAAARN